MKRIASLLMVFVMAATIISVPMTEAVHAAEMEEPAVSTETITDTVDISSDNVTATISDSQLIYTGAEIKPVPVVKYNGETLSEGEDYIVSYADNTNAGFATIVVSGTGDYTGTKVINFEIIPAGIDNAKVTLKYSNYNYTGEARIPAPKVVCGGVTLVENVDYTVAYSNNIFPGKAEIEIKGINNYTGTVTKTFSIAKASNLSLKSRGVTTLKLGWSKKDNVTGYQLWKYSTSKDKWVLWKTVRTNTSYVTVKNVAEGSDHKFKIRAYVTDKNDKNHYGEWSSILNTATKPGKVTFSSLSTNVKLQLKLKWKKENGSGYQIYVSRNSDFSNPMRYVVKTPSTVSKTITVSKNNKYYYVKIRAYKLVNGKRVYGSWSTTKKIKTDGTGWGTFSDRKYYYKNGKPLKGTQRINGNNYYFGANSGVLLGTSKDMYKEIKNQKSKTKYLVAVDRRQNRVCVYHKADGNWVVKYYWKCSTGAPGEISSISVTPSGEFTVPEKVTHRLHFGDNQGYRCWYATKIWKGYYFHSIKYYPGSKTRVMDGRLGYNISHGCVRLSLDNAYWMYKNIDAGTKIIIMK